MGCLRFQSLIGILITDLQWEGVSLQVQQRKFQSLIGIVSTLYIQLYRNVSSNKNQLVF